MSSRYKAKRLKTLPAQGGRGTMSKVKTTKLQPESLGTLNDLYTFKQEYNNKIVYLRKKYVTLKKIKSIMGAKDFNYINEIMVLPLDLSLSWIREYEPVTFNDIMVNGGFGEAMLDFRIKKNMTVKSKRALLLRDINYKELFGVERALELHPCYFDTI
jgi:hypothetical protein